MRKERRGKCALLQAAEQTGGRGRTSQKTKYGSAAGAETGDCLEREGANYTEAWLRLMEKDFCVRRSLKNM